MRRVTLSVVLALVASGVALVAATPASADSSVALPLSAYRQMVVANGDVFLIGGPNDGVVVRHADGSAATVIAEPSPAAMAVAADGSRVYVSLNSADAIAVIDTTTLTETTRYPTGASSCPSVLTVLGRDVWYGYGCSAGASGIGVVDTTQGSPSGVSALTEMFQPAQLASSPAAPGRLFAAAGVDPSSLTAYDVSGTTLTQTQTTPLASYPGQMSISPDGKILTLAGSGPNYLPRFNTADLSSAGQLPSGGSYPNSVADSASGFTAAGMGAAYYSPDVYIFQGTQQIRSYEFGLDPSTQSAITLRAGGLAFSADASRLYAVSSTDATGGNVRLQVLNGPTLRPTSISLTGPKTVTRATALTLTGVLTSLGAPIPGARLSVTKTDIDGNHSLAVATTDSRGHFTVRDIPQAGGPVTYSATWAGDAAHQPTNGRILVGVSRLKTVLTISTNRPTYDYRQQAVITAHLGTTYRLRTVSIYVQPFNGKQQLLRRATVDRNGNLSVAYSGPVGFTAQASFAGDEHYGTSAISVRRGVRAYIITAFAGSYATIDGYRYFHQSEGGAIGAEVHPGKAGESVTFDLQVLSGGTWQTAATSPQSLNANSVTVVVFDGRTYVPFRIRVEYGGDSLNLPTTSAWYYVQFR